MASAGQQPLIPLYDITGYLFFFFTPQESLHLTLNSKCKRRVEAKEGSVYILPVLVWKERDQREDTEGEREITHMNVNE